MHGSDDADPIRARSTHRATPLAAGARQPCPHSITGAGSRGNDELAMAVRVTSSELGQNVLASRRCAKRGLVIAQKGSPFGQAR